MTTLTLMHPNAFGAYREASASGYAEDNVASGRWPPEGALQRAYDDFDESLPQGLATPDNYVYDIEIEADFRRQGHARAAFVALEPLVAKLGLSSIGLHVFGHNPGAQALYNSLGYGITGFNMRKTLDNA